MATNTEINFADQLPKPDPIPTRDINPRADELKQYREMFFDPRYDGFSQELEYLCPLPSFSSVQVESSRLGVGFELLDHRTGYEMGNIQAVMDGDLDGFINAYLTAEATGNWASK